MIVLPVILCSTSTPTGRKRNSTKTNLIFPKIEIIRLIKTIQYF